MALKVFLLFSVFINLSAGAAMEQLNDLDVLAKIIGVMQTKIDRLEKAEAAMKQSIVALVSSTAQFRVKHSELEIRLAECETRCDVQAEKKINERLDQCGIHDTDKRQVPEQVAFSAYLDHVIRTIPKTKPVAYNQVLYNQAGAYDNTSGIFTVPTTGVYLFSWSVTARRLHGEHSYDIWIKLVVNGNHKLGAVAESRNEVEDNQGSSTVILQLTQGDRVWLEPNGGTDLFGNDGERTSSFVGVLLYMV